MSGGLGAALDGAKDDGDDREEDEGGGGGGCEGGAEREVLSRSRSSSMSSVSNGVAYG